MQDSSTGTEAQVVMPVSDLRGRAVWTESGERIGTIRGVNTDDDGRIVSFDVRERWILGPHHEVPANEMRMDGGDVIVPARVADDSRSSDHGHDRDATEADHDERRAGATDRRAASAASGAPVLLAGREGARSRFGGMDLLASFFGALVALAGIVLIGGILGAIFGSEPANVDTALNSPQALFEQALVLGAVTLFLSCFLGGWCAGRGSRFDGIGNGMMVVAWLLAIVVALGALGAWLGEQYNVLGATGFPTLTNDEFALWGIVGFVVALALMLGGAALGGLLGERWHRKADRAMLDVVALDHSGSMQRVAAPASSTSVDDSDAAAHEHHRREEDHPPLH